MTNDHFQQGNGIRMEAQFLDWDGTLVDPIIVKFILYDANFIKLDDAGPVARIDVGRYVHHRAFDQAGTYYYEWYSEIQGLPSLKRERLEIRRV